MNFRFELHHIIAVLISSMIYGVFISGNTPPLNLMGWLVCIIGSVLFFGLLLRMILKCKVKPKERPMTPGEKS